VPHALSYDQRHERVQYEKDTIKTARSNKNFLNSILAENERFCFRYDHTNKRQIAVWKSQASPNGENVCLQKSNVNTMLLIFYDSMGNIHHEFVPWRQIVTGIFYLSIQERLWKRIRWSSPSTQHQAVGFFFTTKHRVTGQ
jgi:hypothetical protein